MNEIKSTVVHANELVGASYNLNINELRLINLACSKVDSKGYSLGEIFISVKEFERVYEMDKANRTYSVLKDAANTLMTKPIKLFDPVTNKITNLAWLIKSQYEASDHGAGVAIRFSPLIEPYLFEIKQRFTSVDFETVAKLNTSFSFRLYQWLKQVEHLKSKKNKNGAISHQLEIKWMKDQAQLVGLYPQWRDFNRDVIKPAILRINAFTDLSVSDEPIKTGRKVTAVKFTFIQECKPTSSKPIRPRLHRRPKVIKGSLKEGEWMRKNLDLLLDYEYRLTSYDQKIKIPLADLRKMAEYAAICDGPLFRAIKKVINQRKSGK